MSSKYEVITSSQNQYVSLARGLNDRKNREKSSLYRFDGIKLVCEAVKREVELELLLFRESNQEAVAARAEQLYSIRLSDIKCRMVTVSDGIFDKLSEENAPEGVIAIAKYDISKHRSTENISLCDQGKGEKLILLESLRDPQNVGAIFRAAAAFGVERIIMSRDCADIYNSKTVRASMGTLFSMKVDRVDSISDAAQALAASGRRVFASALDESAARIGSFTVLEGDCVIIGNEGHGLRDETIAACTQSVYIPMACGVESLNAATAAAVVLWEFFGKEKV